jgi:hypothetical protein
MLEELERRNYAPGIIRAYIRTVEHFAQHFVVLRTGSTVVHELET